MNFKEELKQLFAKTNKSRGDIMEDVAEALYHIKKADLDNMEYFWELKWFQVGYLKVLMNDIEEAFKFLWEKQGYSKEYNDGQFRIVKVFEDDGQRVLGMESDGHVCFFNFETRKTRKSFGMFLNEFTNLAFECLSMSGCYWNFTGQASIIHASNRLDPDKWNLEFSEKNSVFLERYLFQLFSAQKQLFIELNDE